MANFFWYQLEQCKLISAYLLPAVGRPVSTGARLLVFPCGFFFFFFTREVEDMNPFLENVILLEVPFRVDGNFAKAKTENQIWKVYIEQAWICQLTLIM